MKSPGEVRRTQRITQSKALLFALLAILVLLAAIRYVPRLIPRSLSSVMANPKTYMDKKVRVKGVVQETMEVTIPGGTAACVHLKDNSGSGWVVLPRRKPPQKGETFSTEVIVFPNPFVQYEKLKDTKYSYLQVQRKDMAR